MKVAGKLYNGGEFWNQREGVCRRSMKAAPPKKVKGNLKIRLKFVDLFQPLAKGTKGE